MKDLGITNGSTPMWVPSDRETQMDKLRKIINDKYHLSLETYNDFHAWSCENYSEFWEEVWHFTEIVHSQSYEQVIDKELNIADIPTWFSGARLNFAENLLRCEDNRVAIYATREGCNTIEQRTFQELRSNVAWYAAAMKKLGITQGDRVVGYLPNCCETVEAMLAAASIGAIWSSTSPEFGDKAVLERFAQIKPKLMFTVNAVFYNGKIHNHTKKVKKVIEGLPELQKTVIIPFIPEEPIPLEEIPNCCLLEDFLQSKLSSDNANIPILKFEQLPFSHPLFILYSSGTTGPPKCIVHSAGGTLLKHLEEHCLQSDMTENDIMFYYTNVGWMMWNWLVTPLALGSAIVLYDGSPMMPNINILWDLVDRIGITIFGTSAKWLSLLEEKNVKPVETHKLDSLKMILSTGSPLKPQSYEYVYEFIKNQVLLASISGGTDIIACFMGQNWTVPVCKGEVQSFNLGCSMESWDENGHSVFGDHGELVCTKPFPSMPVCFWNDPNHVKYRNAYFSKFEGVWVQGDFCIIKPSTKGIVMLGRSDGTLNPNGIRFGSAEIYQIVEAIIEVDDSLCVAQRKRDGSDERAILFIKMAPGQEFNGKLEKKIRDRIRSDLSVRHVPAHILPIDDIPYTMNGKKVEIAVRRILGGDQVTHRGVLANPNSLDLYSNIKILQDY